MRSKSAKRTPTNRGATWGSVLRNFSFENITFQTMRTVTFVVASIFLLLAIVLAVNLFVSANQQADRASQLEQVISETASIAETLKSSNGDLGLAAQSLRNHTHYSLADNSLILFYDDTFQPSAESDATYRAVISAEAYPAYCAYTIRFSEIIAKRELYALEFKYLRGGGQ